MLPYDDPRDLWQVYRAERERIQAALHLERLARQGRKEGSDSASRQLRAGDRASIQRIRSWFRGWLPSLVPAPSAAPCGDCCA